MTSRTRVACSALLRAQETCRSELITVNRNSCVRTYILPRPAQASSGRSGNKRIETLKWRRCRSLPCTARTRRDDSGGEMMHMVACVHGMACMEQQGAPKRRKVTTRRKRNERNTYARTTKTRSNHGACTAAVSVRVAQP